MKIRIALIVAVAAAMFLTLRAETQLSESAARQHLKKGAVLIDVRTVEEFDAKHLPKAVNIPLDQLKEQMPKHVRDKSTVLLLHCRSGRRSGIAEKELRQLGYTNSFNIGSFDQAQKIVSDPAR